jgi:hypothetical protein
MNNKKTYEGIFNFQGEIHTLRTHRVVPTEAAAFHLFTSVLSERLQRTPKSIRAYFNGSKDNYQIKEVK